MRGCSITTTSPPHPTPTLARPRLNTWANSSGNKKSWRTGITEFPDPSSKSMTSLATMSIPASLSASPAIRAPAISFARKSLAGNFKPTTALRIGALRLLASNQSQVGQHQRWNRRNHRQCRLLPATTISVSRSQPGHNPGNPIGR